MTEQDLKDALMSEKARLVEHMNAINGVINHIYDDTPDNLIAARNYLKEDLSFYEDRVSFYKNLDSALEETFKDYIKEKGEIPFEVDGKSKEYYLKDKEKVTVSKDEEYRDYLKDNFPTLFVPSYTFLEKDMKEAIKNGSITDTKALAGVTTTVTQELATRSVKKSKKTTTVADEGGEE